ncbi:MAG TPA: carboxypeptidase-like regulatory domain-containing protein [Chthonomonadaceae bacterium]|nr:carboxypeptidase-like regulatory domain-containing protein [Chthonomonadaceae bacterium]
MRRPLDTPRSRTARAAAPVAGRRLWLRKACARPIFAALVVGVLACGAAASAGAEELVWASGKVLDPAGRPMRGAFVAVYDDKNKVVDYARTDREGEYALAVPKHLLHLEYRHGKGFIAEVATGVTRFVGGAAEFVANPIRSGVHAVTNAESALDPNILSKGAFSAGGTVVDQVFFAVTPRQKRKIPVEERRQPGALMLKVVAPNRSDAVGVAHIYWMEEETIRTGGRSQKTLAAWLDPVRLESYDSDVASKIDTSYLRFSNTRLEPSIAEPGQVVRMVTRLPLPPTPEINIVVVARDERTGKKWELTRNNDGYFEGEFQVDKRTPRDDQTISLIAYAADERRPGRRPGAEAAIERSGLWDPRKPFVYVPLIVVSRSRADVTLTVVAPSRRRRP